MARGRGGKKKTASSSTRKSTSRKRKEVEQEEITSTSAVDDVKEETRESKRIKTTETSNNLLQLCLDRITSGELQYDEAFSAKLWNAISTQRKMRKRLNHYAVLERLLWVQMGEHGDNVSDKHVKTVMLLLNDRIHRMNGSHLDDFLGKEQRFSKFFERVTALEPQTTDNLKLLSNLISHALSIEQVRSCILSTVSLPLWLQLVESTNRESEEQQQHQMHYLFNSQPRLLKHFQKLQKKKDTLQSHETEYIWGLIRRALKIIEEQEHANAEEVEFVIHFLLLMADLMSQVPTRRFLRIVLNQGVHLIVKCHMHAHKFSENVQFRNAVTLLHRCIDFPIDESTNTPLTLNERIVVQSSKLLSLQQLAFKYFPEKLKDLSLRNLKRLEDPDSVREQLEKLEDGELAQLCTYLNLFLSPQDASRREFLITIILSDVLPPPSFSAQVEGETIFEDYHFVHPTEEDAWPNQDTAENVQELTTITKTTRMQLTYLSLDHYISKYFALYKQYRTQLLKSMIEDVVPQMQPFFERQKKKTRFSRGHPDARPVLMSRVETVGAALVGEDIPSRVLGKVKISLQGLHGELFSKWSSDWNNQDQLVLLSIRVNKGHENAELNFSDRYRVNFMRVCEVVDVQDQRGNDVHTTSTTLFGMDRYLTVRFDSYQYAVDKRERLASNDPGFDPYRQFNLAIRIARPQQSFVLHELRRMLMDEKSPDLWINDAFLGLPPSESDGNSEQQVTVDFGSQMFSSLEHIREVLGEQPIEVTNTSDGNAFKLHFPVQDDQDSDEEDEEEVDEASTKSKTVLVDVYQAPLSHREQSTGRSLNLEQTRAVVEIMKSHRTITILDIVPGSDIIGNIFSTITSLLLSVSNERTLILAGSQSIVDQLTRMTMQDPSLTQIQKNTVLTLGREQEHIDALLQRRLDLLQRVADVSKYDVQYLSCESAKFYFNTVIKPRWTSFLEKQKPESTFRADDFPFTPFLQNNETVKTLEDAERFYAKFRLIFDELDMLRALELIRHFKNRKIHIQSNVSRVVFSTAQQVLRSLQFDQQRKALAHSFNNIIIVDAHTHFECDLFAVLHELSARPGKLNRLVFTGDSRQDGAMLSEVVEEGDSKQVGRTIYNDYNLQQSIFGRFKKLQLAPVIALHDVPPPDNVHPDIISLWRPLYHANDSKYDNDDQSHQPSPMKGLEWNVQFIDTPSKFGNVDIDVSDMNLGEAEMIVQLYMYLRLQGYGHDKITILSTTHGQKNLIRDVLERRCAHNPLFGAPTTLATITEIRDSMNDILLVSMVHTNNKFGTLADPRLLVSMLGHARHGLYMLGNLDHWSAYPHLPRNLTKIVEERGSKLQLKDHEAVNGVQQLGEKVQALAQSTIEKLQEQQQSFMERMREYQQQQQQQQKNHPAPSRMDSMQQAPTSEAMDVETEEDYIVMGDEVGEDDEQSEEGGGKGVEEEEGQQ